MPLDIMELHARYDRRTEVYTGIIVNILDNGFAADVSIPELNTTLKHIPIIYPYYHPFKGEGNYMSVEINSVCKVWFGTDGHPFIMGFGTLLQPSNAKNPDTLDQFMVRAEAVTPGSAVIKTRFGNKFIAERGGFNLNFVTYACYQLLTKIKNYAQSFLENLWGILNGGFWHWWTNYDENTVNFNTVLKNKKDWKKTQLLWISVGEEGKYVDVVLDDKKNVVFQLHVNNDGTVYLKTPKLSIDSPMTVINGKVDIKDDVVMEKQLYVKEKTQIENELKVNDKIAAADVISSEKYVECNGTMHAAGYTIPGSAEDASTNQLFEENITPPAATKEGFDNQFFDVPDRN